MNKLRNVGLADWRVSRNPNETLRAIGLGSCVALIAYEPVERVGGMAHIMLPAGQPCAAAPVKYADNAVAFLLTELEKAGAQSERLQVAVFGGATMLSTGQGALIEIGERNVAAVGRALEQAGVQPAIVDTGGTKGRTVSLNIGNGSVSVRVLGEPERVHQELTARPEMCR